jgi:hypothetical protein
MGLVAWGVAASLTACTADTGDHAPVEEIRNGLKIVHNLKAPAGQALKELALREELAIGGETAAEDSILVRPTAVIADAAGFIYVLDAKDGTVKKYGADGGFRGRIGRRGQGPGEFEAPLGMDLDAEGFLYVEDAGAAKIEVFDHRGIYRRSLKNVRWGKFALLPGGGFLFEDAATLGEGKAAKRILRIATGDAEKTKAVLYSRDQLPFRAIQNKDFRLEIPLYVRWDISRDGRVYLGTANRYEIQALTLEGRPLFTFTQDYTPFPVPPDIRAAALKQLSGSRLPSMPVNERDFEEHLRFYPIFKSITVDEIGRIWVELFQPENADHPASSALFDVFSPEGVRLFSTKIEAALVTRPFFKNGSLYVLRRGGGGYIQAVRYRLPRES